MDVLFERVAGLDVGKASVTVCVRTTRNDKDSGDYLTAGTHRINGKQALAFARDRKTFQAQDLARIKDQQYLISVLLGIEKANIVGHSMGGWLATLFGYESPDRVNKLVLVAAGGRTMGRWSCGNAPRP